MANRALYKNDLQFVLVVSKIKPAFSLFTADTVVNLYVNHQIKKKQMKFGVFLFLILLTGFGAFAQHSNAGRTNLKEAVSAFEQKDYAAACRYFDSLYHRYPGEPIYNYYHGLCLLYNEGAYEEALKVLRFAATQKVPSDIYYHLADAYLHTFQFEAALKSLEKFELLAADRELALYDLVNAKNTLQNALYLTSDFQTAPVEYKESNSRDAFFTSYKTEDFDGRLVKNPVFIVQKLDSTRQHQDFLVFIPDKIEQGEVLYFSMEHPGRGDRDIYRITKMNDTLWSQPENMGMTINTSFDEDFPFMHFDGNTLFFASKGHYSMGGYDVYRSSWSWSENTWSDPENIGFPVNSPFDDFLFMSEPGRRYAFFSSNRFCEKNEARVFKVRNKREEAYTGVSDPGKLKEIAELNVNVIKRGETHKQVKKEEKSYSVSSYANGETFLEKRRYDSLVQHAVNCQMKSDSLRWELQDTRKLYDPRLNAEEKNRITSKILTLEEKIYEYQKKSDECYQKAREIEQDYLAANKSQLVDYGRNSQQEIKKENSSNEQTINREEKVRIQSSKGGSKAFVPQKLTLKNSVESEEAKEYYIGLQVKNTTGKININEELPGGVVYMLQLGAFSRTLGAETFKGLLPLTGRKEAGSRITKYYAGRFAHLEDAKEAVPKARSAGFRDAFVVAFYDGKPISPKKAVKYEGSFIPFQAEEASEEKSEMKSGIYFEIHLSVPVTDSSALKLAREFEVERIRKEEKKLDDLHIFYFRYFTNYEEAWEIKQSLEKQMKLTAEIHAFFSKSPVPLDMVKTDSASNP